MNDITSKTNTNFAASAPFPAARFIKEIGRGKKGARSMSREDARQLYDAMLDGRVSDMEMGGILLAMRIKGESVDEIAGFLAAAEAHTDRLAMPPGAFAPIVLPSYNGSRQTPNLTPLLAMLLARGGAPVLIHGVTTDLGRVTTAEILLEMGVAPVPRRSCQRFHARPTGFHADRRTIAAASFVARVAARSGCTQFGSYTRQDSPAVRGPCTAPYFLYPSRIYCHALRVFQHCRAT
jgi:hypothetical protein